MKKLILWSEEGLNRCPFCGGEAVMRQGERGYTILCRKCRMETGEHMDPLDSIRQWNRRPTRKAERAKKILMED